MIEIWIESTDCVDRFCDHPKPTDLQAERRIEIIAISRLYFLYTKKMIRAINIDHNSIQISMKFISVLLQTEAPFPIKQFA